MKALKVIGRTVSIVPPCVLFLDSDQHRRRASILKELEDQPDGDYSGLKEILDKKKKAIEPKAYELLGPTNFKGGEVFYCNTPMSKMNRTLVADVGAMEIWESDQELQARYDHDLNAYLDEVEADEAAGKADEAQGGNDDDKTPEGGKDTTESNQGNPEVDKAAHIKLIADTISILKEDAFNDDLTVDVVAVKESIDGDAEVTAEDAAEAYYSLFVATVKTLSSNPDAFTKDSGPKVDALSEAIGFGMVADERNEFWTRYQKEINEA